MGLHAWWHWQQRWSQGAAAPTGRGPAHPPTRLSAGWGHVWVPGLRDSGSGATAEMLRQMVRGGSADLSIRAGDSGAPSWLSVGRTDIQSATSPTPSWKPLLAQVYHGEGSMGHPRRARTPVPPSFRVMKQKGPWLDQPPLTQLDSLAANGSLLFCKGEATVSART